MNKYITRPEDYTDTNIIGSVEVETRNGVQFRSTFGKGFDDAVLEDLSQSPQDLIGKWVEVKYMEAGIKDKPRLPKIVRFRNDLL